MATPVDDSADFHDQDGAVYPDDDGETDLNLILISLVKEEAFLYDNKDERRKDRNLLDRTWAKIGRQLGTSGDDVKTRWTKLRNNYGKVLKRRRKERNGFSAPKTTKPWVYESDMDFLREHLNTNRPSKWSVSMGKFLKQEEDDSQSDSDIHSEITSEAGGSGISSSLANQTHEMAGASAEFSSIPQSGRRRMYPGSPELDTPILSIPVQQATKKEEEDPAIGWFKTLLPMINSLSPIGMLDFQSKVVNELKTILLEEEKQRHHRQSVPEPLNDPSIMYYSRLPKQARSYINEHKS